MGAVCTVHASGPGNWLDTGDNPRFEEACANARLIAAAPDLLKAARAFLRGADRGRVGIKTDRALRMAIAKALGEP
jgi:hypothetical protein